jgi:hypothetical protein
MELFDHPAETIPSPWIEMLRRSFVEEELSPTVFPTKYPPIVWALCAVMDPTRVALPPVVVDKESVTLFRFVKASLAIVREVALSEAVQELFVTVGTV